MFSVRVPTSLRQPLIGAGVLVAGLIVAWQIAEKIIAGDMSNLVYIGLGLGACAGAIAILHNWRTGFYTFFVWMMVEDFVRKYMGNALLLQFGKDFLLALVYLSYYSAVRRGREKMFRPPFLLFLSLFFWLGVLQIFNQNSPSLLYGLLGIKIYFYYAPLMFIGYSLIRNDEELRKFLHLNVLMAIVVSAIGISQSVLGNNFLNPQNLAPELAELGNLQKVTASGEVFNLPPSIFVSSGRYTSYLPIAFLIALGAAGYLLFYTKRNRKLTYAAIGVIGVASLLSGSRGCSGSIAIATVLMVIGFLWGAPWRWGQGHRMLKAIRRSAIAAAVALLLMFILFPNAAASRLEFYSETMIPGSANYQAGFRAWDYPLHNLMIAFDEPNWLWGNGIGTTALGTQYVQKIVGKSAASNAVEEGFGTMIVEMGILAPILWIVWTGALLYYCWKVIRSLRETRFFPIALVIGWYAFMLLYQWTWGSLDAYENYTCNIFLWLLVGVLFGLPEIAHTPTPPILSVSGSSGEQVKSSRP